MTDAAARPGFGARLGRAAGNLFLALINATLILFIVAAVVGLLLIDRTRTIAADVASDVTRSAIASTGLDPADTLAELRVVSTEMVALRTALEERRTDLDERTQALAERLDALEATLQDLRGRREALTEAAIDRASIVAGNALERLRGCTPSAAGS
ncbi:hypothetical protein [Microbaculum marinum]|uniref:Uncharacterized protein n=1 Tax=Microbaculum marinum TaxID=1764581 RepID=A0AAW9RMN5_9HYPH